MIRSIFITAVLCFVTAFAAAAQTESVQGEGAVVDSTLVGKDIFSILPSKAKGGKADVKVYQSQAIMGALRRQVASNPSRKVSGYRVRIFNDNKQNSRVASEAALSRFKGMYPALPAYRTYSNPFFRVTVGDFRTKSEAMQLLQQVKGAFPSAFIVKEAINYPVLGSIY